MQTTYGSVVGGRKRFSRQRKNLTRQSLQWVNPYPWMSAPEAKVHLWLESQGLPFSWRWFDGESPNLAYVMADFHPEFTLREYKVIILILGSFWGTQPGVLDKNALAEVLLAEEGWTVVSLWQDEIDADLTAAILRQAPALGNPTIKGAPRTHPLGVPDLMARRRSNSSSFLRRRFTRSDAEETPVPRRIQRDPAHRYRRRRSPRSRVRGG